MSSQVQIVNKALTRLGSAVIVTIGEGSDQADLANALWDMTRDESLEEGPELGWRFARKRVNLVAESQTAQSQFAFRYKLPDDTLGIRKVMVSGAGPFNRPFADNETTSTFFITDWDREGEYIVSNQSESVDVLYIKKVTDWTKYPPHFVNYLAMKLAIAMSFRLQQSSVFQERLITEFETIIVPRTIGRDAREVFVDESSNSWVEAGRTTNFIE